LIIKSKKYLQAYITVIFAKIKNCASLFKNPGYAAGNEALSLLSGYAWKAPSQ